MKMTRGELIELGKKIVNSEGTEREIDAMYELFSKNVPHPTWDIQKDLSTASAVEYFKSIAEIFSGVDPNPEKMFPLFNVQRDYSSIGMSMKNGNIYRFI